MISFLLNPCNKIQHICYYYYVFSKQKYVCQEKDVFDQAAIQQPRTSPLLISGLCWQIITHHSKRHKLEDASTTPLLQALDALLHKTLHKLGVRPCHLGAQDGGDEEE